MNLFDFSQVTKGMTADQIAEDFGNGFLVVMYEAEPVQDAGEEFATLATTGEHEALRSKMAECTLLPLADVQDALLVTVGRTGRSHLNLSHDSVSKFHAFFTCNEGQWSVTDAGSKNGTYVDDSERTPNQACLLQGGEIVRFGRIEAIFHSAQSIMRYLRMVKFWTGQAKQVASEANQP